MVNNSPCYLYMLACNNGATYTGIAADVERRFEQHCAGRGAQFTRRHRPVSILAVQPFDSRAQAARAEKRLKARPYIDKMHWGRQWAYLKA